MRGFADISSHLKVIRSFLVDPETIQWLETFLHTYPKEERLEVLRCRYVNQAAQQISRNKLFQALPHQVSPSLFKRDFTTSCCRLDLPDQTVFFDSGEERIVAQLLHRYGLILKFIEGENLHIRVGDSRSTLDFKVGNVFIEYHPLSMRERDEGLTVENAGERKRARLHHDKFPGHTVIHIWKLRQLYELLVENAEINQLMSPEYRRLTMADFINDLKEAKAYGHTIDRAVRKAQGLPVAG
jgi:hypothetical protein